VIVYEIPVFFVYFALILKRDQAFYLADDI